MAKKLGHALKKALSGEDTEPQLREVIAHFIQHLGGAPALAKLLHDEFHAASPGSLMRQRILETIMRSLWRVNEKATPLADVERLTEEDLEREIQLRIGKFDGKEEERTEARPADGTATAG